MIYARVHVHDPEQVTSGTGHRLVVIGEAAGGALVDGRTQRWWLDRRIPHLEMTGLMLCEFHIHEIKKKKLLAHDCFTHSCVPNQRRPGSPPIPERSALHPTPGVAPARTAEGCLGREDS